ncbi:MAG: HIT domain-containing protein [Candidatus Sedimenticola endophacoides]
MFQLHPRLAADTLPLGRLDLCEARLMNDSRFPWVILVPRREGITELHQLGKADQAQLLAESARVATHLKIGINERRYPAQRVRGDARRAGEYDNPVE